MIPTIIKVDIECNGLSICYLLIFFLQQATALKAAFHALSSFHVDDHQDSCDLSSESELCALYNMRDLELYLPKENTLLPSVPEVIKSNEQYTPFQEDLPKIKRKYIPPWFFC